MISLARARLAPFARVELIEADFHTLALPDVFDVVVALGLFDYLPDAPRAAAWLREHCRSCLVASFTCRDRLKAPIRRVRYDRAGCRIFDFDESAVRQLLFGAGFSTIDVRRRSSRGLHVTASP